MSHVTSADGTRIAYQRAGSGPVVILVDGAFCYRGFGPLGPLADLLATRFAVHTYDRRGRGESTDTPPYAVEREIEDLAALIEAAGGAASVYGVSSGAVLALRAAAAGLPIGRLALFEPPVDSGSTPSERTLSAELDALVAAGRRGDAVERFQTAIGLPPEVVAGLRDSPARPALEAVAHTLVYDTTITASVPADAIPAVSTPTLVIDSEATADGLRLAARTVAAALPNATYRSLPGGFHDVAPEDLARVVGDFFAGGGG